MTAATKTLYLLDAAAGSSAHGSLQDGGSSPGVSTTGTGWTTPNTTSASVRYSDQVYNSVQGTGTFGTTAKPSAAPSTSNCWRTQNQLTGSFVPGNWSVNIAINCSGSSGVNTFCGYRFRVWKSSSQDGQTSVTELTSQTVASSNIQLNTAGATHNVTATWTNPGQIALSGEYLFFEIALFVTGSTNPQSVTVKIVQDGAHSVITTPVFVGSGDIALAQSLVSNTTNNVTFSTQYAGNTNVVFLGVQAGSALSSLSCSDTSGSNTYTALTNATDNVGNGATGVYAFICVGLAGTLASNQVSVTFSGTATVQSLTVLEFDGPTGYDTSALAKGNDNSGATSTEQTSSVTTGGREQLVSYVMAAFSGFSFSAGTGYAIETTDGNGRTASEDGDFAAGTHTGIFTTTTAPPGGWSVSLVGLTAPQIAQAVGSSDAVFATSGSLLGSGALAAAPAAVTVASGAVTGSGALAGAASAAFSATGTLQLYGSSAAAFATSGTLGGAGELDASSSAVASASGSLLGTGALVGAPAAVFSAGGTLQLYGSSAAVASASGTLLGAGVLAGESDAVSSASASLGGAGELDASSAVVSIASGSALGAGALAAVPAAVFAGSGTILATGALVGESDAVFAAGGTLQLYGASAAVTNAAGTLLGAGELDATSAAVTSASGTLQGLEPLVGESDAVFAAQGALLGAGALAGRSSAVFAGSGALRGAGALAATPAVVFAASSALLGAGELDASTAAAFSAHGTIGILAQASASSAAASSASGSVLGSGALAAAPAAVAMAAGTMLGDGALAGLVAAAFTGRGLLGGSVQGSASSQILSAAAAAIIGFGFITGSANVASAATGSVLANGALRAAPAAVFTVVCHSIVEPLVCVPSDGPNLEMLASVAAAALVCEPTDSVGIAMATSDFAHLDSEPVDAPSLGMVLTLTPVGTFFVGQVVDLQCVFTEPGTGAAYDPTSVTCDVTGPDGTVTHCSVLLTANVALAQFTGALPGVHKATWTATGGPSNRQGIAERTFYCQPQ